jgi:topoisomerase IV subunit B
LDEAERNATIDKFRLDGFADSAMSISRFKGLGEMTPEQLWDTTLNPDTRRLVRVNYGLGGREGEISDADMFEKLMAKGESAARKSWLEENGNMVEVDI